MILTNILFVKDVATRLWVFRLWHTVFVLGVFIYAWTCAQAKRIRFRRNFFWSRARWSTVIAITLMALLVLYEQFEPFPLPPIIHGTDFLTWQDVTVNGVQFVVMLWAWWLLQKHAERTVLSAWMSVVACAVAIDILLFVLGGRLFSVGLYISKLNNLIGATMIFVVMLARYIMIQRDVMLNRADLLRANRKLARMALTDPLTGLPNRAGLDQYLERAVAWAERHKSMIAVAIIDLDDFKPVNDRYGHPVGDQLLRAFSERVSRLLRGEEMLARLGGDEFVLVLRELGDIRDVSVAMKRVSDAVSVPFDLPERVSVKVGASIGVAVYPYAGEDVDLVRVADQALYASKNDKHGRKKIWALHEVEGMPQTIG
ncbi:hypothetical protein BJI67_16040 (plasmid) [Acidihalobacter aeolianus]|uniref:GGDEF domain-containing protein n=1 Tax=Acidihalobacter aeolianus TaxID=2792603 RepID=A0A1D8KCS1_9GAMM|nr:sensor domain-containing diguanylate cyclase [Acidihalobacter aeolianus]AOV18751.1 hypothetical protein BJI67_16040 [Acidihalobacter aeolianus]